MSLYNTKIFHLFRKKSTSPVKLWLKLTGAADVQANGYSIDTDTPGCATAARTAEGVLTLTLSDTYSKLVGCSVLHSTKTLFHTYTSDSLTSAKTVVVSFWLDSNKAATDPDSATIFVELTLIK